MPMPGGCHPHRCGHGHPVCPALLCGPFAHQYHSLKDVLAIRDGGLAIYGGIIGAFLFGGLACKWRKVPVLPMFDLAAMGFLIGQGCGRWGNFFNQEAFGCNTTLPGACTARRPTIT